MKPQYYPVEEGVLYAGEYPGSWQPEVAGVRLRYLIGAGVRTFVDLTAPADGLEPYARLLAPLGDEAGVSLRHVSLPIADMGVPASRAVTLAILAAIRDSIAEAPAVYVHCWGGIGRTGTVVGCWLRECGLDPVAALHRVQHLYATHMAKVCQHPESPQTPAQKRYVESWQPAGH
jgi:hypothetical protein